ncbi:MAG: TRAP transporter small permease subunit [Suipraeoptans sp.]
MSSYDEKKIRIADKISTLLALIAGVFLSIATVLMFVNILTRTFADYNLIFIYDVCGLCAAGAASFTIPYVTLQSGHSNMDTIISRLSKRVRSGSEALSGTIAICAMLFTVYTITTIAYQKTLVLEATTSSGMPIYIFRWLYVLGMVITTIAAIIEVIDLVRIAVGKQVVRNSEELEEGDEENDDE